MSARDKARVYRMIETIDPILDQREGMIENVDQALQEAKALEEERHKADLLREYNYDRMLVEMLSTELKRNFLFLRVSMT